MSGSQAVPVFAGLAGSRVLRATLMATVVAAAGWMAPVRAQADASPGRVVGTVLDSTSASPLVGASVFLWDTPHQAMTDETGRFSMEDIPPGTYSVVFFHPRLRQLGLSAGPRTVVVRSGGTVGVDLAIPSAHTLEATRCAYEAVREGIVVGRVTDLESAQPLPRVRVDFSWVGDDGRSEVRREARTGTDGWYRICDLPRDRTVAVTARFLDRTTPRREVRAREEAVHLDLRMARLELMDVNGRLVDLDTGEGIGDATVVLEGTGFTAVTDGRGRFHFDAVLPGEYTLSSNHLGYGERSDPVHVAGGERVDLEVALSQRPIELPPVLVEVSMGGVRERAMGGTVIGPAELDPVRSRSRDALDLIRNQNLSGLVVRRQGARLCLGFLPGQTRMMGRSDCVSAVVFVDNVRAADPRQAMDLPAEVVDRIVLYRPIEAGNLFGLGAGNGVVMIFTKH